MRRSRRKWRLGQRRDSLLTGDADPADAGPLGPSRLYRLRPRRGGDEARPAHLRRNARQRQTSRARHSYGADTAPIGFSDVLHVGNSFSKDFVGARDAGMRAVLSTVRPQNHGDEESIGGGRRWREAGAAVVHDLSDVLEHVARGDFALGCCERMSM